MSYKTVRADLPQVRRFDAPGDTWIQSSSLKDFGFDPINEIDVVINSMRQLLGDLCFVERRNKRGDLIDLFVVPEWPEECPYDLRRALNFHAILINRRTDTPDYVLQHWGVGAGYRRLEWEAGMALIESLPLGALSSRQLDVIAALHNIDNVSRARPKNMSPQEMRLAVGPRRGARLYLDNLIFPGLARNS